MTERNLWSLGFKAANNPGVAKQFMHSKPIHGLKRSLGKKVGYARMATRVVAKATQFIPVPCVGDLVKKGMDIASNQLRKRSMRKQKGAADSLDKLVKLTIKDLDISDLDRYRFKIKEAQDDFAKTVSALDVNLRKHMDSDDVCTAFFGLAKKRGYLVRRLIKMRARTKAIKEIVVLINKWCADVENSANKWRKENKTTWETLLKSYPESMHAKCGDTICVQKAGSGPSGSGQFGEKLCEFTSAISSFVSLDDLTDFSVDRGLNQIPSVPD